MTPKKAAPKIVACPHCKSVRPMPLYVIAHWSDMFTVTCEDCGEKFSLYKGKCKP